MKAERSRSTEQIFADMHRELRNWNPEIPESHERLDPIVKILLELYSHQLARIDRRLDQTWDTAATSLIRSVCPESKRWPVPAYTVMCCQLLDPAVEVDHHTRFFFKEKREGGQNLFFSPINKQKLLSATVKHVFLRTGETVIDLSPGIEDNRSAQAMPVASPKEHVSQMFIAVDYEDLPSNFNDAVLFMKGAPETLKQLRWAHWYPGSTAGSFYEDSDYCPGLTCDVEQVLTSAERTPDWGGLRTTTDIFKPLEDSFVIIPEQFASTWEIGPMDDNLTNLLASNGIESTATDDSFYWLRLDLPAGGDRMKLLSPIEFYFNSIIVVNKNELTLFKHTGGNRLIEIELPEDIANILEITNVTDSSNREYSPSYLIQKDPLRKYYSFEDRDNKLVLWFDFSSALEPPPDSITITYSVTKDTMANGIEAGMITELYENHPGIGSAENIIPTTGGIPARDEKQIVTEVSSRLRNRDRALSFTELAAWARTFDPRILHVQCENGVERADRGIRRCIIVKVTVNAEELYSNEESSLLQLRLVSFLKARSPINTQYKIEIIKK